MIIILYIRYLIDRYLRYFRFVSGIVLLQDSDCDCDWNSIVFSARVVIVLYEWNVRNCTYILKDYLAIYVSLGS